MEIAKQVRKALEQRAVDAEVARRVAIVDGYGPDREDGTVLRFDKVLPVNRGQVYWTPGQVLTGSTFNDMVNQALAAAGEPTRTYTYVAIRLNDLWYLSGDTQGARVYTWEDLTIWLAGEGEPVTELVELLPAVSVAQQAPRQVPTVNLEPDPELTGGTGPRGNSSGNGANDRPRKTGLISTSTLGGVPRHWMLG